MAIDYNDRHLCRNCGFRFGLHRGGDSKCPAAADFPKYPHTVREKKRAEKLYDDRIHKFWSKRNTHFKPA